mmetsp:Transcript_13594/g.23960  ORF Transcript_13594/g.23960 Transcript_13594/m.23960 type:complete len:345 (+) Transcript_13594:38-1072(+)|eukprot:CAMPEP_0197653260 /NCGR_PEP_ID=MMETSP1338-20131121/34947_1 /TAXON_ID=43686 ORGANISM="Pelagodinium beii, Strain RCC1491" /NCGR_SAMPLE_ID=MMETSP1338 /ASSEMBLY_ACC=CAM_ASM_000754 /LENGTH=344 /DNA_ID=CAMNT_0043228301 /DNA_START=38 /DNA_END=1072 /DNA_ORIENTATION=+
MTHWGKVTGSQAATSSVVEPVSLPVEDIPPITDKGRSVTAGIRGLYQKCQMYDITVVVGESRLPAHKVVLAAMSKPLWERVAQAVNEFQAQQSQCAAETQEKEPKAAEADQECKADAVDVKSKDSVPAVAPAIYDNQWSSEATTSRVPETAGEGQEPQPSPAEAAPAEKVTPAPVAPALTRPELHLEFINSPEAARVMLDRIYGLSDEYEISSDEANNDVLRLAKTLELPCLEGIAMKKLVQDLSTENVIPRLATCKQFELTEMYEAMEEEVCTNMPALRHVSSGSEVMEYPELLQSLLVRSAGVHRPAPEEKKSNKRALEEPAKQRADKAAKVSSGKAVSGGA